MKTDLEQLEDIQKQLDERGIRVGRFAYVEGSTYEQRIKATIEMMSGYLNGDTTRIFMIDTPDENGWIHALEDAWNIVDKAGNVGVADKLEEIIKHHMKLAND